MKKYLIIGIALVALFFSSCTLDTTPTNEVSEKQALSTVKSIRMAVLGLTRDVLTYNTGGNNGSGGYYHAIYSDFVAGYIVRPGTDYGWWTYEYNYAPFVEADRYNNAFYRTWKYCFFMIRRANAILATKDLVVSESEQAGFNDSMAQAYAFRSYMYFILNVNYASRYTKENASTLLSVPIRTVISEEDMARNTAAEVVTQMLSDVNEAIKLFETGTGTADVATPNLYSAKLLKARILFYTLEYEQAREVALDVINNSGKKIMSVDEYNSGWIDGNSNSEWIQAGVYDNSYVPTFYSFRRWVAHDYVDTSNNQFPNCFDVSFILGRSNEDLIEGEGITNIPDTRGLTMSLNDERAKLYLLDSAEEVKKNGDEYYHNLGFTPTASSFAFQGRSRKYSAGDIGPGSGDIVYFRLAEAYYIAAESSAELGDDAMARTYLAETILPYDPAFVTTESGDRLKMLIANYKAVDMYAEGRGLEDVKRRGTQVYRIQKYHPELRFRQLTQQYSSIAPFVPAGNTGSLIKDFTTLVVPERAMDSDPLLVQNPE